MAPSVLSSSEIEKLHQEVRRLCNKARFGEARLLAKRFEKAYPNVLVFSYLDALLIAEDTTGCTTAETERMYRAAAEKLRLLLRKMRAADPHLRFRIRNEYYWFSRQPYKQYLLGKEQVTKNKRGAYYSQGVGAVELAKRQGLKGQKSRCLKWAKISERAWNKFLAIDSNWFNAYYFYGMSLAFQGRFHETEKAIHKMCKIAGKSSRWKLVQELRREIDGVVGVW